MKLLFVLLLLKSCSGFQQFMPQTTLHHNHQQPNDTHSTQYQILAKKVCLDLKNNAETEEQPNASYAKQLAKTKWISNQIEVLQPPPVANITLNVEQPEGVDFHGYNIRKHHDELAQSIHTGVGDLISRFRSREKLEEIEENKQRVLSSSKAAPQQQQRSNIVPTHNIKSTKFHPVAKKLVSSSKEWNMLQAHVAEIKRTHLRNLLQDEQRCDEFCIEYDGVYLDYSRQRATKKTVDLLIDLAKKQDLKQKIDDMFHGKKINFTEDRAVLHTALRMPRSSIGTIRVDDQDIVKDVHLVLDQIKKFSEGVRSGELRGYTGKRLRNIISVGIGGSFLGPEFLHECLKTEPDGVNSSLGFNLRFLANVDPVDIERTCADLDPEETLIIVISKTFTTAETMLNARTMRQWLWDFMGNDKEVVRQHFVACASTSASENVAAFGIDTENRFFKFWDWVGGRYSVCSAVGAVPISLMYGFDLFQSFLDGARSIDKHFTSAPFHRNIPVIMGLLGVWNMSFMGYNARTALPYSESLCRLPAHIQQLDMESNGKYVTRNGLHVDYPVGEIDFGEAGTNGQHSFYQLLHMGQTIPCDFIGFVQSQHDFCLDEEELSSHDELMANFFAQPDALAYGKTADEVRKEGVQEELIVHRTFQGNRPSLSLLLPKLTAYASGQLLAIYEHRTAVQGFIWDINSFDQWGVELGKKLACDVKSSIHSARNDPGAKVEASNPSTTRLLNYFVDNSRDSEHCRQTKSNPITSVTRRTFRDEAFPPERNDLVGGKGRLGFGR